MPREPACRNCADKKVGCKSVEGANRCERCHRKNLQCERPVPPAVPRGSMSRRTACDRCRDARVMCERDANAASAPCVKCAAKGMSCSFTPPEASTAGPILVVDTTTVVASADSAPSSSARSPSRPFWETVLAPSPGVDG